MFQNNQIELSTSPFRFTPDRIDLIDFTIVTWVTTGAIVFRHPQSGLRNIFLQPLSPTLWRSILLLTVLVTGLVMISMKFQRHRKVQMTVIRAFILTLGVLTQQGVVESFRKLSVRTGLFVFMIFSLIIYQFYSSFIVSSLLTNSPKTINSLRQLIDSQLEVGIEDVTYNYDFFQTTNDPIAQELYKKKIEKNHNFFDIDHGLKLMRKGGFAFHVDTSYGYKLIQEIFTEQEVCELHEILLYPIRPLSVAVAKDSPFREFVKVGLQRLVEKSLMDHQTKKWSGLKPKCVKSVTEIKAVDISEASPILILLVAANISGFLILICEIIHFKFICPKSQ